MATTLNSDIMALPDDVAAGCDLTYTDPPWGVSPLKMFETHMEKSGYGRPGNLIEDILSRLFALTPKGKPCFVEYGVKSNYEQVVEIAQTHGLRLSKTIPARQMNGNPFVVLQFDSDMPSPVNPGPWDILLSAIEYHQPRCVFEPFAGLGLTAGKILEQGVSVVASEINPGRYRKMLDWLGKYR